MEVWTKKYVTVQPMPLRQATDRLQSRLSAAAAASVWGLRGILLMVCRVCLFMPA